VPAKTNPLGAKGCGEAGCAGALPAVMNAVVDALSEYGIRHIDMPATPIDASRRLIHPGLVNAHTHSHGNLAKGMGDRWTLELLLPRRRC
jgi:N-acyl-D-aspartate/D-glutamate deacylase